MSQMLCYQCGALLTDYEIEAFDGRCIDCVDEDYENDNGDLEETK